MCAARSGCQGGHAIDTESNGPDCLRRYPCFSSRSHVCNLKPAMNGGTGITARAIYSGSKVGAIRDRMIEQAEKWYGDAVAAANFMPYTEKLKLEIPDHGAGTSSSNRVRVNYADLYRVDFEFKEMAWHPIGKIAYMLVSSARSSHRRVDSRGRVEMIYAAHCMNENKREDAERAEMLSTGTVQFKTAQAAVVKLLNGFHKLYATSYTRSVTVPYGYIRGRSKPRPWQPVFNRLLHTAKVPSESAVVPLSYADGRTILMTTHSFIHKASLTTCSRLHLARSTHRPASFPTARLQVFSSKTMQMLLNQLGGKQ